MRRDHELHDMLRAMGVAVEYVELASGRDGEYWHQRQLIRMRPGMSERLHRSVLAHECAHAVFADVPSMFGPVNAKQERRAEEWAALRLIDRELYEQAELIHDGHAGAIAHELGIVHSIVVAYRRILLRTETATYVAPKMGSGQYLARAEAG